MSAAADPKAAMTVHAALNHATADQLRRAIRRKLADLSGDEDESGEFIDPDDSRLDDVDALENARSYWLRGNRTEALHHLEIALGRDFSGLGQLRPEDLK